MRLTTATRMMPKTPPSARIAMSRILPAPAQDRERTTQHTECTANEPQHAGKKRESADHLGEQQNDADVGGRQLGAEDAVDGLGDGLQDDDERLQRREQ